MKTNAEWLQETIEFTEGQKRRMQVGVFYKENKITCFGVVQRQDGDDVLLEILGNTPSTIGTKTTRRITTADITDVITELL